MDALQSIHAEIMADEANRSYTDAGIEPLYVADPKARIAVVGQAPGKQAQDRGLAWADASGERLCSWLGVTEERFRDPTQFALLPMDFYYPGKGRSGDRAPRRGFAATWHPRLLDEMPDIELIVLAGQYAVKHYLGAAAKGNLTETIRAYRDYLPRYLPIVHPSPLNFRWHAKQLWFEAEVVPALQQRVADVLGLRSGGGR